MTEANAAADPQLPVPVEVPSSPEPVGTRLILHFLFGFLGIFSAETISGNLPWAPLLPILYPIYGGLYLFFLDSLLRRRVPSWPTVYLYGVLVGYLTESFAAKVMWFGWPENSVNLLGVLPWPEFPLLAFFFHPVFSFLIPVYLARRYLGLPLALPTHPTIDRVLPWVWPLFAVFQVHFVGLSGLRQVLWVGLDVLIFLAILQRFSQRSPCRDLRLAARTRALAGGLVLVCYLVFLFRVPPFQRTELMLPSPFQLGFSIAFSLLVLGMVWSRIRELPDRGPIPYDPGAIPLADCRRYGLYVFGIQVAGVFFLHLLPEAPWKGFWVLLFLVGTLAGTLFFLRELGRTRWWRS